MSKHTGVDMTDQEKNEVLLKFAGFRYREGACDWLPPDQESTDTLYLDTPDLLHSLDAQAKWIYPKLYEVKLHQRSNIMNGQWCAEVFIRTPSGCIYRDTPAIAVADAVLSLIGNINAAT